MTTYRHKKTGGFYQIIGKAIVQAENWRDHDDYFDSNGEFPDVDGREVVLYRNANDPTAFYVRPEKEFFDRFEEVK
jgi:hypothetical protein